ncbi:LacI family DNA-binding transcriptional regulator [Paenibacillus contaminans]|uniref:Transcriptional repressor PurR n=1 Tax=Paenibacillus contaminans TaxID=450362 RepID=A0A329MQV9_9BACL|nr:LacI family DNA-binding transcriptional regulator [Paenibacillus contaminans]RAV22329.1 transcriptional repressor PurR [Paenibacillus contaminans]
MITRKDVAKKAGVSTATVSRVMSGYAHISKEVRDRVLQAAEELHYTPNLAARSLKLRKTQTLACIVPDMTNPYFVEIFKGVHLRAKERGYHAIMEETDFMKESSDTLTERRVDGAILCGFVPDETIAFLAERLPLVSLQSNIPYSHCGSITEDLKQAASRAVCYLAEQGHRRIGIITRDNSAGFSGNPRLEGYLEALKECGLSYSESDIVYYRAGTYSQKLGYEAMKAWIARGLNVSAALANNDLVAIGAIAAASEAGILVPEDLSLIGFDDTAAAAFSNPPLTSVKLEKQNKGMMAVDMLLDSMDGKHGSSIRLETELIIRKSVRNLNGGFA